MIQNSSASTQRLLAALDSIQTAADQAQRQLTSGLRVERPSDAPWDLAEILQLRSGIEQNDQIQANLGLVQSEVSTADSVLQDAMTLLDYARELALRGTDAFTDAAGRASMVEEVEGILQQLVGISATTVSGRFIFGGDQDGSAPYEVDYSSPTGVNQLTTSSVTRQIQDASGMLFSAARTATEMFDARNPDGTPAETNVFAAVNSLRVALENDDITGIASALDSLKTAEDYLGLQLTYYGTVQTRVDRALDLAKNFQVQLTADLSDAQDADAVAAATALSQAQVQQQAALSAEANRPKGSLFDYLG
jgi:flagellar hook-associated protein 3 FlgL